MNLPSIVAVPSTVTEQNQQELNDLQNNVRYWRFELNDWGYAAALDSRLAQITEYLRHGDWLATDVALLKDTLLVIGETLLCAPKCARRTHLAVTLLKPLRQCGWWREWAADSNTRYLLASTLLQSYDLQRGQPLHANISQIVHLWCQEMQSPAAETLANVAEQSAPMELPILTIEQTTTSLFGPSWLALYDEVLANASMIAQHIREVRPPFAWKTVPSSIITVLPPDLDNPSLS